MNGFLFGVLCYASGCVTIILWRALFQHGRNSEQDFDKCVDEFGNELFYTYHDFFEQIDDKLFEEFEADFLSQNIFDDQELFYYENNKKYSDKLDDMYKNLLIDK